MSLAVAGTKHDAEMTLRAIAVAMHTKEINDHATKGLLIYASYDKNKLVPVIRAWLIHTKRNRYLCDAGAAAAAWSSVGLDDDLKKRGSLGNLMEDVNGGFRPILEQALHDTCTAPQMQALVESDQMFLCQCQQVQV